LNGATVQGRAIVVNKSEPKPEGERRSFNNTWWRTPWRFGATIAVVVTEEEDINIFFSKLKDSM
jgi:hypothetical protein